MRLYFPSCTSPGQKGKGRVPGRKQPLLCGVVLWPALCGKHHDSNIIVITTNVLASHRTHLSAAPPSNCWCDKVRNHLSIICQSSFRESTAISVRSFPPTFFLSLFLTTRTTAEYNFFSGGVWLCIYKLNLLKVPVCVWWKNRISLFISQQCFL